ncbi:MAG: hypothetical protein JNK05_21880 [Myxococcales bacterium]|nr:hypothetical protein [Myxococcales bacterium]
MRITRSLIERALAALRRALERWAKAAPLWMLISCVPTLDAGLSTITAPRVLAVRVEPAEVGPGEAVSLVTLVASSNGAAPVPRVWRCDARRTLSESASVSQRCTGDRDAAALAFVGEGERVRANIPANACELFGPNPPEPEPGEPAGRPVDPDPTGGYFVPFRVAIEGGADAFAEVRVRCPLAGAPPSEVVAFNRADRGNENTEIAAVELRSGGELRPIEGDLFRVRTGETVQLSLRWPSCPAVDRCGDGVCGPDDERSCSADCATVERCRGAERYVFFDRATRAVIVRRESMRAAFYQSAGTLKYERVGRAEADTSAFVQNDWTAPAQPGEQRLWFVLRDDRGGASWVTLRAMVER